MIIRQPSIIIYLCIVNLENQALQLHEGQHIHKYGIRQERGISGEMVAVRTISYLQPLQG
jgi:hypothetical protein